ncbi:MAG: response regulator [Salinimicrobium sediminis]|uniref:cAMP-binding domain of CRP or a regulatory subunit of cAMP-dependent protein kinases n=1 Tax=Salinimicrobium sediminis TaxID=1343891 RepID=A0A285X120_9FLAO|nr:response regulator [Salinimicrobium sediminis]MDX1602784.1 response regulator [Salinimicrobium sediminis]SOC78988.1 cAMP-binding domain of CRP or a regulatory subunit of cAMP-dependent protein kinases [Salinimicrobium sediminis]
MKKVLIIEDDTVVRENTAELLELADYDVITAPNGKSGLAIAKKELPNIIVCDIMMPEMDGYGVLQGLAEDPKTQQIPFIFLSAKTEHKDIRKGMDLGADDYLTKPFEEDELISAIESRLAKVAILNKLNENSKTAVTAEPEQKINSLQELRQEVKKFDEQTYKAGEVIYEEGKQSNHFFFVDRGVVKSHRMDEYGKELITSIYKEGDFFGNTSFHKANAYSEYATAMEDTRVYAVTKEELKNLLMNNSNITLELIDVMGDNISGIKEQLLEMAYGSVRKKAARTILLFSQKIRRHPTQSIRISRSDLASVAGMASETLIRTLSDFKKEGLLEIEGRNIKLLDVEALKRII